MLYTEQNTIHGSEDLVTRFANGGKKDKDDILARLSIDKSSPSKQGRVRKPWRLSSWVGVAQEDSVTKHWQASVGAEHESPKEVTRFSEV